MPAAFSLILPSLTGIPPLSFLHPPLSSLHYLCSLSQHYTHGNHFSQLSGPKMSALWAVFLLCSLLTPSQGLGIMASIGQVDGKCMEETGFTFFFETSSALSVS